MGQVVAFRKTGKPARSNKQRKVPAGRPRNADLRSSEYLLHNEAKALQAAAGSVGTHLVLDRTLILSMYRHGLRVAEATDLTWDQVDCMSAELHVRSDIRHPSRPSDQGR